MSKELAKMNLISVVQQLPKKDIEIIQGYVEMIEEQNQSLKKQLEEYKATNEVLSHELTKDKVLQQDCLTTCCGIPIGNIPKLITQQKEFISYLENMLDNENDIFSVVRVKDVLSKYKEIIGQQGGQVSGQV